MFKFFKIKNGEKLNIQVRRVITLNTILDIDISMEINKNR